MQGISGHVRWNFVVACAGGTRRATNTGASYVAELLHSEICASAGMSLTCPASMGPGCTERVDSASWQERCRPLYATVELGAHLIPFGKIESQQIQLS